MLQLVHVVNSFAFDSIFVEFFVLQLDSHILSHMVEFLFLLKILN